MSLKTFFLDYIDKYRSSISWVDLSYLEKAIELIKRTAVNDGHIYVGGNGGSAAISNHLCCDFIKGPDNPAYEPLKAISLSCNTPLITAIANDIGYEETLSYQLERLLKDNSRDVVILISSSGNSKNIIQAAEIAKKKGATLIGLTGFDGGKLYEMADIKLHVQIRNYGVVEDCHQSIMHIISQYITHERTQ